MASIILCDEIGEGRSAQDDIEGKASEVRQWRVRTDGPMYPCQILDTAHTASPDPIAIKGEAHPYATFLFCKSRTCRPESSDEEGNKFYIVTANYDNQFKEDPANYEANPLDRPVKYGLEWSQYTAVVTKDAEGDPILNVVKDEFEEPLEEDDDRPVLTAIRNEDAANFASIVALAIDYRNATNSDTFYGAPPGCVKMAPIELGEVQYENGQAYYAVRYAFAFKEEQEGGVAGWNRQILNRGFNAYKTANTESSKYNLGADGPKNLKEDGTIVGPTDDPYYLDIQTKKRRSFGALGL